MDHVPGVGGGVQARPVDVVDRVEALREELVGPDGVVGDREAGNDLGEVIDGVGARVERGSLLPRVFVGWTCLRRGIGTQGERTAIGLNLTPGSRESYVDGTIGRDR